MLTVMLEDGISCVDVWTVLVNILFLMKALRFRTVLSSLLTFIVFVLIYF
jgi:hypothetical protein